VVLDDAVVPYLDFFDQWDDPKFPWHDRRLRLAANHAIERIDGMKRLTPRSHVVAWNAPPREHALTGANEKGPAMDHVGIDVHKVAISETDARGNVGPREQ
jgi:hypothetical protein